MEIVISHELALYRLHGFRFLEDFSSRDFTWLLIGVFLAMLVTWGIARRRRRWF